MPIRLSYTSPSGRTHHLIEEDWTVGIQPDGIEGLIGTTVDKVLTTPGQPGQILTAQDVEKMEGTLRLTIASDSAATAAQREAQLRADFHPSIPGTLTLAINEATYTTPARRARPTRAPDVEPEDEEIIDREFFVVSDLGFWKSKTRTGTGIVSVTNRGDLLIYPRIRWTTGGVVFMPSGASFTLPDVSEPRIVLLDPLDSLEVMGDSGLTDYALMLALAPAIVAEPVPPGATKLFTVPAGAELMWEEGILDPFQEPRG